MIYLLGADRLGFGGRKGMGQIIGREVHVLFFVRNSGERWLTFAVA